jgi:hypothetical protein
MNSYGLLGGNRDRAFPEGDKTKASSGCHLSAWGLFLWQGEGSDERGRRQEKALRRCLRV